MFFKRIIEIDLPERQSAFLWGARKAGKTTYLKHRFPDAIFFDLLHSELSLRYAKEPSLFREELLFIHKDNPGQIIIVDEIQKVPALMDEIHWLIENTDFRFILCGSSSRQMKRHGVNMLGGRAWKYHFLPLCFPELGELDLLTIFKKGTLPSHYLSSQPNRALKAYLEDYLTLEIQAEGLVRNLPAFARFVDALRFTHGEMVNYTTISREAGVDAKTVRSYFDILVDTLFGYYVMPFRKRVSRDIISATPKFYLFDVGVANYICKYTFEDLKGPAAGKALEHYILTELIAYKFIREKDFEINYWRTKDGYEVDFVLERGRIALEVKISEKLTPADLRGLKLFHKEHQPEKSILICQTPRARHIQEDDFGLDVMPIKTFLSHLWAGKIIE